MIIMCFIDSSIGTRSQRLVEMNDVVVYFFAGLGFAHSDIIIIITN
jgi:hypothetical protein